VASHINHKRGFAKLQPTAAELTLEELEARSKALDAEIAPTRPPVETPVVEPKPKPPEPDELEKEIEADKKRRGFFKLLGK